jgi:hypothetical protein
MVYWTQDGLTINGWEVPQIPLIVGDILAGLALVFAAYTIFFGDRYRFEIEGSRLRYIKGNDTKYDVDLTQYSGGYQIRTRGTDLERCTLTLSPLAGGDDIVIECEALGQSTFYKMWAEIERYIPQGDNAIETK